MSRRRINRRWRGQALTEFTIVLSMMLSVVLVTVLFLAVFSEYSYRLLMLIGLEYP